MSEKPKTPPNPEAPPPDKRPLENPQVDVRVSPKTRGDRDYAEKVRKNLTGEIEKVVKENADGGHKDQFKKAEEKAKDVGTKVDPSKVKEISVDVSGKVGKQKMGEETVVKPGPPPTPTPAPPPAPDKKK
jgi:hypothetical protein